MSDANAALEPQDKKNGRLKRTPSPEKRELGVLNSIFNIISSATSLPETLEQVLDFVLGMVNSSVGWVCLHRDDGTCTSFTGYKGLCFASAADGKPAPCMAHCVCDRVRRTRDVVVMNSLSRGCPLLLIEGEPGEMPLSKPPVGHVSVPLMTQARLVGQLNIAFDHPGQIGAGDIALLRAIGPQLAVAIENARLLEEIQNKEVLLKSLFNKVVTAQEEERRRISRELHDEMGQSLTSLLIGMRVLENSGSCEQKSSLITGMETTVSGMISSIHDMALELRPPALDDLGLVPALAQYMKDCPGRLGIAVDYEVVGESRRRLPREAETTIYRIVQESLTNVARHAAASKASVMLRQTTSALTVIIEDNGRGFDLQGFRSSPEQSRHLGLFGMEERAALVGGKLTIESSPGAGTSIYIEIPYETAAEAA